MTDHSERGRFIWHELMTPNTSGAQDFYAEVVGWRVEALGSDSSHLLFTGPAGRFGGISEVAPTAAPRWVPFVTVEDLDDALSSAQALGADIVVEPTSTDGGGRYAVLTDPQGAAIGIYSAERLEPERSADIGEFSWHELAATDHRAAFEFYRQLFGWERLREADMGAMGVYLIFGRGGKQLGGMFDKTDIGQSGEAAWLSYVRVEDLQGAIAKLERARGSLLHGPAEVPGGDSIAQVLDPYGAAFALHALAADMKPNSGETYVVELWSDDPEATDEGRSQEARRAEPTARTRTKRTAKASRKKSIRKKAAGSTTKKTAAKKAGKKTAKKSTKKKSTKKKAAKKSAKKAAKKTAKKTAKKRAKKVAKKTGKKVTKKTGKKTTKKASKKTAKKTGKKAAKRGAKKTTKKTAKKPTKKAKKKESSTRAAGSKNAAKKPRKKAR